MVDDFDKLKKDKDRYLRKSALAATYCDLCGSNKGGMLKTFLGFLCGDCHAKIRAFFVDLVQHQAADGGHPHE